MKDSFSILDWDSNHFGFRVASIELEHPYEAEIIDKLLIDMKRLGVKLAYCSIEASSGSDCERSPHRLAKLVDRKTLYSLNTDIVINENPGEIVLERYTSGGFDSDLEELALQSGEYSRFKVDNNIATESFESLYRKWMSNSICDENIEIYLAKSGNKVAGFITLYRDIDIGNIGLLAVDKRFRGQGIGNKLLFKAVARLKSLGCVSIEVVTQGDNRAACQLYEKAGFIVKKLSCFYHLWI